MQWLAFLASNLSSPGITLGFDFYCSPRSCRLVSWSVGQFFSRLALEHELYIEAQKKILPHFFAFEISFT
jgi:hypothetical protein